MAVRSVQFTTPADVVEAYENQQIARFAICADKQFLFKFNGDDIAEGSAFLQALLDKLQTSAAIYTLKVYEDPEGGKLNEKTPCDGSFNFRFLDAPIYSTPGTPAMNGIRKSDAQLILEKLEAVESRMQEIENNEPAGSGQMGMIGELLDNPMVQSLMPAVIEKLFSLFDNKQPTVPGANVMPMQQGNATVSRVSGLNIADRQKIDMALVILEKSVADLPALMTKLADMAQKKPAAFKGYVTMFMAMK